MNFGNSRTFACNVPEANECGPQAPNPDLCDPAFRVANPNATDCPNCSDPSFAAAHPELCTSTPRLILKPEVANIQVLGEAVFTSYLFADGRETLIPTGVAYSTSNPQIAVIGVVSGSATGVSQGITTITASYGELQATARIEVSDSCANQANAFALIIDHSKSMSNVFSATAGLRLDFAKRLANGFIGCINPLKDRVAVFDFDSHTNMASGLSQDTTALQNTVNGIQIGLAETDIQQALQSASDYLNNAVGTSMNHILIVFTDFENKQGANPVEYARLLKTSGTVVMVVSLRSSGFYFNQALLAASGGFFYNVTQANETAAPNVVQSLKTVLCSAACARTDNFIGSAGELNYTTFNNWTVIRGYVDLIGDGGISPFYDVLPGNGLYIDLVGSPSPGANGLGTIITNSLLDFTVTGDYAITFMLAGNNREARSTDTVTVSLIDSANAIAASKNFTREYTDPFALETWTVNVNTDITAGSYRLQISQASIGGTVISDVYGCLLDSVHIVNPNNVITFSDNFDHENPVLMPGACDSTSWNAYTPYNAVPDCTQPGVRCEQTTRVSSGSSGNEVWCSGAGPVLGLDINGLYVWVLDLTITSQYAWIHYDPNNPAFAVSWIRTDAATGPSPQFNSTSPWFLSINSLVPDAWVSVSPGGGNYIFLSPVSWTPLINPQQPQPNPPSFGEVPTSQTTVITTAYGTNCGQGCGCLTTLPDGQEPDPFQLPELETPLPDTITTWTSTQTFTADCRAQGVTVIKGSSSVTGQGNYTMISDTEFDQDGGIYAIILNGSTWQLVLASDHTQIHWSSPTLFGVYSPVAPLETLLGPTVAPKAITVSGAGTSTVNGIFNSTISEYFLAGSHVINIQHGAASPVWLWKLVDAAFPPNVYYTSPSLFGQWTVLGGASPAPTVSMTLSTATATYTSQVSQSDANQQALALATAQANAAIQCQPVDPTALLYNLQSVDDPLNWTPVIPVYDAATGNLANYTDAEIPTVLAQGLGAITGGTVPAVSDYWNPMASYFAYFNTALAGTVIPYDSKSAAKYFALQMPVTFTPTLNLQNYGTAWKLFRVVHPLAVMRTFLQILQYDGHPTNFDITFTVPIMQSATVNLTVAVLGHGFNPGDIATWELIVGGVSKGVKSTAVGDGWRGATLVEGQHFVRWDAVSITPSTTVVLRNVIGTGSIIQGIQLGLSQ